MIPRLLLLALLLASVARAQSSVTPGKSGASQPGQQWITAFEIDFTTQATQDLLVGGDGYKTINGISTLFYVSGTANLSAAQLTLGTGVTLTANANVNGGAFILAFDNYSLGANDTFWNNPLEAWLYYTKGTITNWCDFSVVGRQPNNSTVGSQYVHRIVTGAPSAGGQSNGMAVALTAGTGTLSTYDVGVIHVGELNGLFYGGNWSSGWPARSALDGIAAWNPCVGVTGSQGVCPANSPSKLRRVQIACATSSGVVIKAVRLMVRR